MVRTSLLASTLLLSVIGSHAAMADCRPLPNQAALKTALEGALGNLPGLQNEMWGTIVDRDGIVCAVAFTGDGLGDQWPGSRVISAQKANTANAFSLPADAGAGIALSSGNLYGTVLEQGSLFGLQFSNPVDTAIAYKGPPRLFGRSNDPMVGRAVGGVNVFGGGLALYRGSELLGGLGVSGDTSCADHIVAWRTRDALGLDAVPGGISATGDDNLIIDPPVEPGSFEHPECGNDEADTINDLPNLFPIGE
jgi:Haem-degrading